MKKFLKGLTLLVAVYLLLGFWASRQRYPLDSSPNSDVKNSLQVAGSIHFHSVHSDGSGTVQEIARAAAKNNLDFLILTDHGPDAQRQVDQKFYSVDGKNILFLAYAEIGNSFGHYLQIEDLQILAHPFHPITPWKDLEHLQNFDGLEIYSGSRILQGEMFNVFSFMRALLLYPFNPDYAFISICHLPQKELELWNQMNQDHPTFGIVSTDAHANIVLDKSRHWHIPFPSYASAFKTFQNHFLLSAELDAQNFQASKALILEALRQGRFYGALDSLLPSSGFNFYAQSEDQIVNMGSKIAWKPGLTFKAHLGQRIPKAPYKFRLLKNGAQVCFSHQAQLEWRANGPGTYRVEVYIDVPDLFGRKKPVLWIISNPIWVS